MHRKSNYNTAITRVEHFDSNPFENIQIVKTQTKQLKNFQLLVYISFTHSVTKHKAYDFIKDTRNAHDPFNVTDENNLNSHVNHRNKMKAIKNQIIHEINYYYNRLLCLKQMLLLLIKNNKKIEKLKRKICCRTPMMTTLLLLALIASSILPNRTNIQTKALNFYLLLEAHFSQLLNNLLLL